MSIEAAAEPERKWYDFSLYLSKDEVMNMYEQLFLYNTDILNVPVKGLDCKIRR